MNGAIVKLGDHIQVLSGFAFKSKLFSNQKSGLPLVRIRNVVIGSSKTYYLGDYDDEYIVKNGDLLIGMDGDFNRELWKGNKALLNQRVCKITADKVTLNQKYLYYLLPKELHKIHAVTPVVTVKHLSVKGIKNIQIPLPPLETQKQIVQILATADQLCKDCQQVEQELNALAQSVFLEMFGDPVSNPKGWVIKELSEVSISQLGKMLSKAAKQDINPKKYLRNANIRWGYFDLRNMLEMDFIDKDIKKFNLLYGDLLVCEGGDVGRCAIWKNDLDDCYYQKALHRVRGNPEVLTSEYLQQYFYWMSKLGALLSSTSTVTFSHLTAEKLKRLKIPIPPISQQKKFSSFIEELEKQKQQNKEKSQHFDNLFNSLLQKAFKGELNLKTSS